jgi:putative transposase
LLPTEVRRPSRIEDENAKLRKVVADLGLGKEMLQDALLRSQDFRSYHRCSRMAFG